jgi:hypothetical protein
VVEWLPSKAEALSSNPATEKKTKKKLAKCKKVGGGVGLRSKVDGVSGPSGLLWFGY